MARTQRSTEQSSQLGREIVDAVEKLIVASPFGHMLGLETVEVCDDRASVRLPFRSDVTTIAEMVHGGAIASLIDVAATAAAWATPTASLAARGSTVGLSVNYLAPGLGSDLVADARVTKRGGTLCAIDVDVTDDKGATVARALVTYRLSSAKPAAVSAGVAAADTKLRAVESYAAAKSRQDVQGALAQCHPNFRLETIPFGTASTDRDDTAGQLAMFFSVFPDYRADTEATAINDDGVAWWGNISLTFAGDLLGIKATGKHTTIPAFSIFDCRDGLLERERFYFDLAALCDGLGIERSELTSVLSGLRAAAA
jgi:uncharacterized protein (TIGR00369 family)